MNLVTIIYLADIVPTALRLPLVMSAFVLVVSAVICLIQMDVYDNDQEDSTYYKGKRFIQNAASFKPYVIAWLAFAFINSLIPSSGTAYKMMAAYGVTEIAKTEEMRSLGGKSLEVLDKAMSDYLGGSKESK